ncbi:MAG: ComEA family DNA-binding protein [Tepidisphaerales bacterium]
MNRAPPRPVAPYRALAVIVLVGVAVGVYRQLTTVDERRRADPGPDAGPPAAHPLQLDPNTADAGLLAQLPGLGPARARAVVAYRQQRRSAEGIDVVFRTPADLLKVRGIGPATVQQLTAYLRFPDAEPDEEADKLPDR